MRTIFRLSVAALLLMLCGISAAHADEFVSSCGDCYEFAGDSEYMGNGNSLKFLSTGGGSFAVERRDESTVMTLAPYVTSGSTTTYLVNSTAGGISGSDYQTTDNVDLFGKAFEVEDALGRVTAYEYDGTAAVLESVTYPEVPDGTFAETYTYYPDGNENSPYVRTVRDTRGYYTLYKREVTGQPELVTEIRVSQSNTSEPANWDDGDSDLVKQYAYYTADGAHGLKGQLYQEIVPNIDVDQSQPEDKKYVKTYEYDEVVGSTTVFRGSPTRVKYKYWNGTSYELKTETTSYDEMGRVLSQTDANSRTIWHTYDKLGRQLATIYSVDGGTPTVYTESDYSCCALDSSRDENGYKTYYVYDDLNRVSDVYTDISGQGPPPAYKPLVHYTYDDFGNVRTVTTFEGAASDGRTTTYSYDGNNRVTSIDYPGSLGNEAFGYDEVGNLIWKQDGEGAITLHEYDELNRLTDIWYNFTGDLEPVVDYPQYPGDVHYEYGPNNGTRLKVQMDDDSGTTEYAYDNRGTLSSYTPQGHGAVTYVYNALGQKTSMTHNSIATEYSYYANGWLKQVKWGATGQTVEVAAYTYDAAGNRDRVDLRNDTYTLYVHADNPADPRYLIASVAHWKTGDSPAFATIGYTRDNAGNPLSMGSVEYTYDENSRLDSETGIDYNYDWVGNRLNPPTSPGPMQYNAADQLTVWPQQNQYAYYTTGSLFRQLSADGNTVEKEYTYTPANLLSEVEHQDVQGTPSSTMVWDGDSNRVSFTSSEGTGTWYFVYDTTAGIPAVIEENDGTPVYYIREPNGALIARDFAVGESRSIQYYHFDALGSTRALTDDDGDVTDRYSYDAWGNTTHTGSTEQPYQFVGQLGYYTHWQDENLDLIQLGVRFYDPETGRFTQRDPAMDGLNWYVYTVDSPTGRVDPTGLTWSDNWGLFWDWWTEYGSARIDYGPTDPSTLEMRMTPGVAKARAEAAATCSNGDRTLKTWEGIRDTMLQPWNGTAFQVGAYRVAWRINCASGTITYTIFNRLSLHSFFYHLPWIGKPWRSAPGPGGNMHQFFTWTEPAPPGCCCPATGYP